jgi:hypothetical protein
MDRREHELFRALGKPVAWREVWAEANRVAGQDAQRYLSAVESANVALMGRRARWDRTTP